MLLTAVAGPGHAMSLQQTWECSEVASIASIQHKNHFMPGSDGNDAAWSYHATLSSASCYASSVCRASHDALHLPIGLAP